MDLSAALKARKSWLSQQGLLLEQDGQLSGASLQRLRRLELDSVVANLESKSGLLHVSLKSGATFSGRYVRDLELAQGRFAFVKSAKEFTLAPTCSQSAKWRRQDVILQQSGRTLQWRQGRHRTVGS